MLNFCFDYIKSLFADAGHLQKEILFNFTSFKDFKEAKLLTGKFLINEKPPSFCCLAETRGLDIYIAKSNL